MNKNVKFIIILFVILIVPYIVGYSIANYINQSYVIIPYDFKDNMPYWVYGLIYIIFGVIIYIITDVIYRLID